MILYADIIREVNTLLKKEYPSIKRYGNDTVDNAVPPYFFVEVVPYGISRESQNMMKKSCSVKITFVQKTPDQVEGLSVVERIFELLGMTLKIKNRKLLISDYNYEYIENHENIPQISFQMEWYESTEIKMELEDEEILKVVHLKIKEKGSVDDE